MIDWEQRTGKSLADILAHRAGLVRFYLSRLDTLLTGVRRSSKVRRTWPERRKMIYLYVRHTVMNDARWKEGFDIHFAARQAGGATREAWVLRNVDDLYEIVVVLGWRDLARARSFMASVSWQIMLQEMGVVGVPEVRVLESVF